MTLSIIRALQYLLALTQRTFQLLFGALIRMLIWVEALNGEATVTLIALYLLRIEPLPEIPIQFLSLNSIAFHGAFPQPVILLVKLLNTPSTIRCVAVIALAWLVQNSFTKFASCFEFLIQICCLALLLQMGFHVQFVNQSILIDLHCLQGILDVLFLLL